ncbi:MAG TPA: hypothetical protein PK141_28425, partial [Polyangiaceae bacterium]|nr:hypothetical protein [Polyangiaceae bacterium]
GEVHHTANVGSLSVHLTFGVDTRRGVELLAPLRERAVQERLFREDLTRLAGDEALRERTLQLKARLHALVDELDVDALLAEDDRARSLRCLAGLGGAEVAARAPATSFVTSAVRRRLAIHADGDHGDERVLDAGARTFRLSRGAVGVLEVLATLERPTLADLAGALGVGEDEARRSVVELAGHGLVGVEWAF